MSLRDRIDREDDARSREQAQPTELAARRAQDEAVGLAALDSLLEEFHTVCVEKRIPMAPAQDYEVEADPGYSTSPASNKRGSTWSYVHVKAPAGWPILDFTRSTYTSTRGYPLYEMIMLPDGTPTVLQGTHRSEQRRRTKEQMREINKRFTRDRAKAFRGWKDVPIREYRYVPASFSLEQRYGYDFGVIKGTAGRIFLTFSQPGTDGGPGSPAQLYAGGSFRDPDLDLSAGDHPGGTELADHLGKQLSKLIAQS